MTSDTIKYNIIKPEQSTAEYIQFFWHLTNLSDDEKKVIILPDGYFDIIYYSQNNSSFQTLLVGLASKPAHYIILPNSITFAVSFKLLAAEYILHKSIANLLDQQAELSENDWMLEPGNFYDFASFVKAMTQKINGLINEKVDNRKQKLFDIVYNIEQPASVQLISESIHWSSRQINRYFKNRFGITLKKYCNILRYRASFKNLKEGKLFPEEHFADQAHFIKEIRKFSGVTPKELAKNENDRFIQLSTLTDK